MTAEPDDAAAQTTRELSARRALFVAAGLTVSGVGVAGTTSREAGGVLLLAGWAAFVWALHGFGRAGGRESAPGRGR